jgi:hypothetical protein
MSHTIRPGHSRKEIHQFPDELSRRVAVAAAEDGTSQGVVIATAVREYLDAREARLGRHLGASRCSRCGRLSGAPSAPCNACPDAHAAIRDLRHTGEVLPRPLH